MLAIAANQRKCAVDGFRGMHIAKLYDKFIYRIVHRNFTYQFD